MKGLMKKSYVILLAFCLGYMQTALTMHGFGEPEEKHHVLREPRIEETRKAEELTPNHVTKARHTKMAFT